MAIYENLSPNGHYTFVQRIFQKLKGWIDGKLDEKVDISITGATTSVTDYLVSPYTMLSALPFGDSSLRLGDGSIFVHKDEMIESTMIVVFNNGIRTYGLAVDGQTAEVTSLTEQGSWTLNQVGLAVSDVYRDGSSGWVGTDHSLANVLSSLNTSLGNKQGKSWTIFVNEQMAKNATHSIPSGYNELMIYVAYNAGDEVDYYYPFHVVSGFPNHGWIMGYGASGATYAQISTINNTLKIVDIRLNGNVLSRVKVMGLYR